MELKLLPAPDKSRYLPIKRPHIKRSVDFFVPSELSDEEQRAMIELLFVDMMKFWKGQDGMGV